MMLAGGNPTEVPVDRKRRGPDGAELREPRHSNGPPRRQPSVVDAILDLQATAGNRAVTASLDRATAQREPTRTGKNDGGALTLDSGEPIPLQSATWSLKVSVANDYTGKQRTTTRHLAKKEIGTLVITRASDAHSARFQELMGSAHERGSLRLDKPSRDGALPATSLTLKEVSPVSYSRGRGDDRTETMEIAVDELQVAGMGKEASAAAAVAHLQIGAGSDAWPPLPVTAWEGGNPPFKDVVPESVGAERLKFTRQDHPPDDLKVEIAAGMSLTRLAEVFDQGKHLDTLTVSPRGGGMEMVLQQVLVTKLTSTADPSVVQITFAAENSELRRMPGGATPSSGRRLPRPI